MRKRGRPNVLRYTVVDLIPKNKAQFELNEFKNKRIQDILTCGIKECDGKKYFRYCNKEHKIIEVDLSYYVLSIVAVGSSGIYL